MTSDPLSATIRAALAEHSPGTWKLPDDLDALAYLCAEAARYLEEYADGLEHDLEMCICRASGEWVRLRVEEGSYGSPRIVDANGKPVCSFGNQARHRGHEWAWETARLIVKAVNRYTKGAEYEA